MIARSMTATALVLVAGCAGSDPDTAAPPPPAAISTPVPASSPGPTGTVIEVTYQGGQVTGVEPRVPVALGEQVVLRVTSDVEEEIHVHGYDLYADIPAGGTGEVAFSADLAGSWEVELHEAGRPLFQLRVS